MSNTIHIAGHLGSDPESRFTSSGKKVTTLRVATRVRRGQNDDTIWWRVTIWEERFEKMMPHLKKGSAVMVVGELHKPEIFQDREGKSQVSMEITAFQLQFSPFGRPQGQGGENSASTYSRPAAEPTLNAPREPLGQNPYLSGLGSMPAASGASQGETFDDEVPF